MSFIREIKYWSKRFYRWIISLGDFIDKFSKIIHLIGTISLGVALVHDIVSNNYKDATIVKVSHEKDSIKKISDSCTIEIINYKYGN